MSIRTGRFSVKLLALIAALSLMGSGVAIADENPDLLGDDVAAVENVESSPAPADDAEAVVDGEESPASSEEPSETPETEGVLEDKGGAGANVVHDPKLRNCINNKLNRDSGLGLTKADLSQVIGGLSCTGDVGTLEGVQYLRNVETLDFEDLYTANASALQKLAKNKNKLTTLYYPRTASTTLPDLSGFTRLALFVYDDFNDDWYATPGKPLTNISNLGKLTSLTEIRLNNNNISDISALAKLKKLEKVNLDRNRVKDISPLAGLRNLTFVDLDGNNVSSIPTSFRNLPQGIAIGLSYNNITSVPALPYAANIDLQYNKIKDFSQLSHGISKDSDLESQVGRDSQKPAAFAVEAIYDAKRDVTRIDMRSFRGSTGLYTVNSCKAEKKIDSYNGTWYFDDDYCNLEGQLVQGGKYVEYTGEYYTGQFFSYVLDDGVWNWHRPSGYVQIKYVQKFSGIKVTDVQLSGAEKVATGKSITLKASVLPSNAANKALTWTSSNKNIATVSAKGVVTGKKPGTVTITAKAKDGSGKKASKKVTVVQLVTSVKMSGASKVDVGKSIKLTASVAPSNASNKAVSWASSNKNIATVNAKGVVTGKKPGTVTITATAKDGSKKKASKTVKVIQHVKSVKLTGVSSVAAGYSTTLKAVISPSNASDKAVTWASSNKSIATVKAGKVTANKAAVGKTVTIKVTTRDGKKSAWKKIKITKPVKVSSVKLTGASSVVAGQSIKLMAGVSPANATDKRLVWKSSNANVATVDASGKVTAKNSGKVTITAVAKDGSGVRASKTITVTEAVQVMYRLYNRVSHEHLYTADAHERDVLRRGDWNYEGIGWIAPKKSNTPVYRLYNPGLGDHHYTTDTNEVRTLTSRHGWRNEGVKWYSDDKKRVKVYRQFNPGLRVGSHNYTADKHEYDVNNARNGWRGEGVAWYAVRLR